MSITRTPIIDDDGSGHTGTVIDNAWKQELYAQIDAMAAPFPNYSAGSWTPADGSGAGLVFSVHLGTYVRIGSAVLIQGNIRYPATASGATAAIAGLPFPSGPTISGGLYHTYGIDCIWYLDPSATRVIPYQPATVAIRTNAELSGAFVAFAGLYFTS